MDVQIALQLDGLILLNLFIGNLNFVLLLLSNDRLLLEFNLTKVSLHFLLSFQLLMMLLFVVDMPVFLMLFLLLFDSLDRHVLLILDVLKQFIAIELFHL